MSKESEFDWALGLNRAGLRAMGLWPSEPSAASSGAGLRVPLMMFVLVLGLILPECYALAMVMGEFQLVIDNLATLGPSMTSCLKLYFMWKNREALGPVVGSASEDWLGPRAGWQLEIMRGYAARARLLTILGSATLLLCYLGYVLSAFLSFDVRIANNITDHGQRSLMLQSYYPFDYSSSPAFELLMFLQQLSSLFIGVAIVVPDDYFVALVLHASGQYRILAADLERAVGRGPAAEPRGLAQFIDRHAHLHRMVGLVERSFAFVVAAQVVCMCSVVCCLGFETPRMLDYGDASAGPAPLQLLTLVGTLLTMLLLTLVDCFACESLASSSEQVFFSIRASDWYIMSPSHVRYLIPMMIMSQNPRKIKAGKLLSMSMDTYCSIVKSIVGYISVLVAVSSE